MVEQVISFFVGIIAPFLMTYLKKFGLSGVTMLWAVYIISALLAVAVNAVSGTLDWANVTTSIAIITGTAQTIYHAILKAHQ